MSKFGKKTNVSDLKTSFASIIRVNVWSNCKSLIHISLTSTLMMEAEQVAKMFISDSLVTKLIAQADFSTFILSKMYIYPTSKIKV
jgi:hypothetical protein